CGPCSVILMVPKSVMYMTLPSGEKRTESGRSSPPVPLSVAGPLCLPRFTAKSSTTPVWTFTRTTLNPTGFGTLPTGGAISPNSAMDASPTWPNRGDVEKSKPLADACTPSTAVGLGGVFGCCFSRDFGDSLPGTLNPSLPSIRRPGEYSGQPYHLSC